MFKIPKLLSFLMVAKNATYANENIEVSASPLLLGSKQLEFSDGEFVYRDIYVDMFRFLGQEIVYFAG